VKQHQIAKVVVKLVTSPLTVRIKSIAPPVEHGGWAFLIEPLLLGLFLCCIWSFSALSAVEITLKDIGA
jgi:hypothetical protein